MWLYRGKVTAGTKGTQIYPATEENKCHDMVMDELGQKKGGAVAFLSLSAACMSTLLYKYVIIFGLSADSSSAGEHECRSE